jgi:hypothetical protein
MDEKASDRVLLALRRAAGEAPLSIFIDPTLRDPTQHDESLQAELMQAVESANARRHVLPNIHDDFDPSRRPFLLHVAREARAERVVSAAVRIALSEAFDADAPGFTGRTVCGWIVHDEQPSQSARALAQAARLLKPDGQRHYLRLWDPRVCWHLPARLPAAHWAGIRAAMGRWMFFDPLRQLVALDSFDPNATIMHTPPDQAIHRADVRTWQSLERIAPVNKVLAMSWDWGLLPNAALAQQADELVARSIEHGFDSEQDMLVFAACGLTSHPQFDKHPQVRDALAKAASASAPLRSALEHFDDTFWAQLQTNTHWLENTSRAPTALNKAPSP